MATTNNSEPECFGKLWEPSAAECAGGYDRAYTGRDGSKVRDRCDWFEPCRQRLEYAKGMQSSLLAPQSLVRAQHQAQTQAGPFQPPMAPPFQQMHYAAPPAAPVPGKQAARPPFPVIPQVPALPQFQPPQFPQHHLPFPVQPPHQMAAPPIQMVPMSYAIPRFLSTPENRENGEFWGPIAREGLRGAGKGFFATLASFFDHVAFRGKNE